MGSRADAGWVAQDPDQHGRAHRRTSHARPKRGASAWHPRPRTLVLRHVPGFQPQTCSLNISWPSRPQFQGAAGQRPWLSADTSRQRVLTFVGWAFIALTIRQCHPGIRDLAEHGLRGQMNTSLLTHRYGAPQLSRS